METYSQDRIMIVDDEPAILDVLTAYFKDEGFAVLRASDGADAVRLALSERPDLMVLDLNLPNMSGVEVFRKVRAVYDVPVIMLTSRVNEVDRVVGLELGADDYIGKPFSPREVVARVKGILRRYRHAGQTPSHAPEVQRVSELTIDRAGHEVRLGGTLVSLTPMEFRILDTLSSHLGQVFSRAQLLDKVAPDSTEVFDRTLDRHIANLRRKIEADLADPQYVITVLGVGYKMVDR